MNCKSHYTIKYMTLLSLLLFSFNTSAVDSDHFVTTWETTVGDTVITIPTFFGETYNYAIDWDNDMVPDETGITGNATHDYGVAGVHTIRIFGAFPRIYINGGPEKDKILSIEQWGTNQWISMTFAFYGASNLVNNATDTPDLTIASSLGAMFGNCGSIGAQTESGNWNWNTSNIISLEAMFTNATSFDKDISSWNVENVTNFDNIFNGVSLSNANYDALLISWDAQTLSQNESFSGGNSQYCSLAGQTARASIITNDLWTIADGGLCSEALFRATWKTDNSGTSNSTSITIPTCNGLINPETFLAL